jgi:hypothetical protein
MSSPSLGAPTYRPLIIAPMVRRQPELVAGVTATVLFGLLLLALAVLYGSSAWAYDFAAYHAAVGRLVATGSPYQAATLAGPFNAGPAGLYLYSPLPVVLLLPLAGFALNDAALVFLAVKLAALLATCALMPVSWMIRLAVLAVACISAPVLQDLNLGNASLVVTFLAVVSWRYLDRPAGSAGVTAALAIRPTMALFLAWWVLRGRLRPLLWAAAVAVVLFLVTLPFVGLRSWSDYLTVLGNLAGFAGIYRNFALDAVLSRLGLPEPVPSIALFAGYATAAGAVVLSLHRDRELSFVVTLGATLLISPLLWDHYLTNLLVPAAFLASRGWWPAVLLPLLCWLPQDLLPVVALVATLLPFAAPGRGEPAGSMADRIVTWRPTPRSMARA